MPSYAASNYTTDQNIHGRIIDFDGNYNLTIRDERGYVDNVQIHPGTIINPTGLTLAPGMIVSVLGYNAGDFFSANEIDTPYQFTNNSYYYAGHPWSYYGPSISLGFFFGNLGWWHGNNFHGPYGYARGTRIYSNPGIFQERPGNNLPHDNNWHPSNNEHPGNNNRPTPIHTTPPSYNNNSGHPGSNEHPTPTHTAPPAYNNNSGHAGSDGHPGNSVHPTPTNPNTPSHNNNSNHSGAIRHTEPVSKSQPVRENHDGGRPH